MKRLTRETKYGYEDIDECVITRTSEKLGRLEDIEEELGCPLDLYAKMCIFGTELFSKPHIDFVQYKHKYIYVIEDKCFCLMICGSLTPMYYVKDYGITWSLRKEDLQ